MKDCSLGIAPIVPGDKFNLNNCSSNYLVKKFCFRASIVYSISKPFKIYCDNSAVVFLAKNNKNESHSRHIDIKYLKLREHVKSSKVIIRHISTRLMIVDPLTKGLPPKTYKEHVEHIGLNSIL